MMLQMLAKHSTHAKHAPATPPAAPAATASLSSPSAASAPAAASPAPAAVAQQHAMIQLRTMMPPKIPHTVGSAVCGALLPTIGTLTGGASKAASHLARRRCGLVGGIPCYRHFRCSQTADGHQADDHEQSATDGGA